MPDIRMVLPVAARPAQVLEAFTTPELLDAWWTLRSAGLPVVGNTYEFFFGEPHDWRGVVERVEPGRGITWRITRADADWTGTRIDVALAERDGHTIVTFRHDGWPADNDHYRTSAFCWAMYLRLMKRFIETGEVVPYEHRLDA